MVRKKILAEIAKHLDSNRGHQELRHALEAQKFQRSNSEVSLGFHTGHSGEGA